MTTTRQTSPFLTKLPLELRQQIYRHLFQSLTFTYGKGPESSDVEDAISTPPAEPSNPTPGILTTCRQISQELPLIWPQCANFSFLNTQSFIFFLSKLPPAILQSLHHVTVKAFPIPMSYHSSTATVYNLSDFFPLFPGLRLDVLTVHDSYHDPGVNDGFGDAGTYHLFEYLLESKGWKQLHFYSPTSEFLSFGPPQMSFGVGATTQIDSSYTRQPQPSNWQDILLSRDGHNSEASVKIYRSKSARTHGKSGITCADLQYIGVEYEQARHLSNARHISQRDAVLASDEEREKEVLVVVKRGKGVDYKEDGQGLSKGLQNIRRRTWEEIRELGLMADEMEDPCAWL